MISSSDQEIKTDRSLSIPKFRKIPLKLILVFPFVVLVTGAVGLVGYFSYRSGQETVANLANQLIDQASNRVIDRLDTSIKPQQQLLAFTYDTFQSGKLDINTTPQLQTHFWQQINSSPNSSGIFFSNNQGKHIGYRRIISQELVEIVTKITGENVDVGTIFLEESLATKNSQRNYYLVDSQGKARKLIASINNADTLTTDWYIAAQNAQRQIWSPIYIFRVVPTIGISSVIPIYDTNKKLQGVWGNAIALSEIGAFLNKLNFSTAGQSFIMERSGNLVATSTPEIPYTKDPDGIPIRLLASQSQNQQTRAIATYLQQKYGTLNKINDVQRFRIVVDGVSIFAHVKPYQDDYGLDWLIVTAIPESDFMGEIQANTRWTFFLCGMTLFAALGMGIATARWITKPIDLLSRLSRSSTTIAQQDWQLSIPINLIIEDQSIQSHPILEIATLADSFHQMLMQLQESHRKITENLQQAKLDNQNILSVIPDLMFINDSQGLFIKTLQTNSEQDVNVLQIDVVGKPLQDILSIDIARQRIYYINQALQTGKIQTYEQQIEVRGKFQDEEVRIIKISDREALTMIRNISDRKLIERELTKAKEAAETANQTKSRFIANMSHELRTPLNAILGFSQLMQHTPNLPEEHYKNIEIIYRSGNYLLSLINNILDLSKIEADKATLNIQKFNLYSLLFELEEMMRLRAEKSGLSLIFGHDPDLPAYIYADEIKLKQVLINLLTNAIKFTKQGEIFLTVNCSSLPSSFLPSSSSSISNSQQIPAEAPSLMLHFSIQDTGVGIAPEELPKIFKAFTQAEAGREAQEGTGLGLTISQRFVQLMGGEIKVTSELGQGTTFRFQIPVQKGEEMAALATQIPQRILGLAPGQPEYRILVVDDLEVNRQLLVEMISPLGFQVQEAKNGQEAIDLWASWQPQLIWMDLQMPIMDGYTAIKQIRTYPQGKNTIIIALTANIQQDDRATVLAAGCDDFYLKPCPEQSIFAVLRQYLGVSYIYAEESEEKLEVKQISPQVLTTEDFASMPPDWLQRLSDACAIGNFDLVAHLIAEIPATDSSFAQALAVLADQFQSEAIMKLIQPLL